MRGFSIAGAILINLWSMPAFAGNPQSGVCLLTYRTASETVRCTAALVAPDILATAAHCMTDFSTGTEASVYCGPGPSGSGLEFNESFNVRAAWISPPDLGATDTRVNSDFAFLRLNHRSAYASLMRLPDGPDEFRQLFMTHSPDNNPDNYIFKSTIECRTSGFGQYATTASPQFHTSDQSPANGLHGYFGASEMVSGAVLVTGANVDWNHGDSGGPFYCRTDATSPWYLLGLVSSGAAHASGMHAGVGAFTLTASREFQAALRRFRDGEVGRAVASY